MSPLLGGAAKNSPGSEPACTALFVGGVRHANSAAKFWPALVDEVRQRFPDSSRIELATATSAWLSRELLFPQRELEQAIERLKDADLERVLRETLAQLALTGPPASVILRVLSGDAERLLQEIPTDCLDAEIFPYLVVWLLEWAQVAEMLWNLEVVEGAFTAVDRNRRVAYRILFRLESRHLSEGLYRRTVVLTPIVSGA
jgi:hypothetical protein